LEVETEQAEAPHLTPVEPGRRWICVDFANTVVWRASDKPIDMMTDYGRFLLWGERGAVLRPNVVEALRSEAERHPRKAEAAFRRAIELREAIYRVLLALGKEQTREPTDVALINREVQEANTHRRLVDTGGAFEWRWSDEQGDLDTLRWRIALSMADLVTSEQVKKLKSCPGEGCAWLFVDTSRNGARRWCEMEICGNRNKVRRHRQKT
jgi:predicted RNA-binding Zn ribbon-like protein